MPGNKLNRRKFLKYRAILGTLYQEHQLAEQRQSGSHPQENMQSPAIASKSLIGSDQPESLEQSVNQKLEASEDLVPEQEAGNPITESIAAAEAITDDSGSDDLSSEQEDSGVKDLKEELQGLGVEVDDLSEGSEDADADGYPKSLGQPTNDDAEHGVIQDPHMMEMKQQLASQLDDFDVNLNHNLADETEPEGQGEDSDDDSDIESIEDLTSVEDQLDSLDSANKSIKHQQETQATAETTPADVPYQPEPIEAADMTDQELEPEAIGPVSKNGIHPDIIKEFEDKIDKSLKLE